MYTSSVCTQHNGLSTPMLVRFLLDAQEALHESVLQELDEEMSLHDEDIWQLNDAIRKAIADNSDQYHVVARTDKVRHRMQKHSTSLQSHCFSRWCLCRIFHVCSVHKCIPG